MAQTNEKLKTFAEFWPFYLGQHSKTSTKWIHFLGTTLAIATLIAGLATGVWWLFLVMFIAGYGPAWYAHFFVEHNRPATFTYPLWSLAADFKMWSYMLTGRIKR